MTEETALTQDTRPVRRRASRAAGPAGEAAATTELRVEPAAATVRAKAPMKAPPRRRPNGRLVASVAGAVLAVVTGAVGALTYVMLDEQRSISAEQARDARFVDTATQTVVNMFSYTQDTIDDSVNRFINGTSGPLRDMMSQGGNADNLKALFRDTKANSETVVSGAALEKVDNIANNASVLVSVRVTVTDLNGVNAPSKPYRMRVIVHEDDNGNMTGYDLKYPDGGN